MKIRCPVCGVEGHLQVRGKSARVGHYVGYRGKTRIVEWHKVDASNLNLVNNGNQTMVINKEDLCPNGVLSSYGGSRRGARGPLYRKPSIRRAECLGEASKIARLPQSSNRDYPSL